jgi:hypothetical protein
LQAKGGFYAVDGIAEMDEVEAKIEAVLRKAGVPEPV